MKPPTSADWISLFCVVISSQSATAASLTALGKLPGGNESAAFGVSDDGSVVVGHSRNVDGSVEAFRWTSSGGMIGLGDRPRPVVSAWAVSADGRVIAGAGRSTNTPEGGEAVRWTETEGTALVTGELPQWVADTFAADVSADGRVVVGGCGVTQALPISQAFRWTAADGMEFLGDFAGGPTRSWAHGISADGRVIVGLGSVEDGTVAFRWTAETGMTALGQLPGSTTMGSEAWDASADGTVIVGGGSSPNGLFEAFRWTAMTGMGGLGDFSGGEFRSVAFGVSADGSVVVGRGEVGRGEENVGSEEAFVWTAARGMQRLWDLLLEQGIDPARAGWNFLSSATEVSADGRFVVGYGGRNNGLEAFLADLAPRIEFASQSAALRLSWPAPFKLQRTPSLVQPDWRDVADASSPFEERAEGAEGEAGFFRLVSRD